MDTDKEPLFPTLFRDAPVDELNVISEKIIGSAYKVGNDLGCGFLERVYENALAHEIRKQGMIVSQQGELQVFYDGVEVGRFQTDLLVEGRVLVELKAVRDLNDVYRAQCMNYLRASRLRLCLLINFGNPRVEVKRIVI